MDTIILIGVIVISYLLGSVSFSYLFGKLLKGIDIRQHGSGNAGATNTLRVLGVGPGITVLLLDVVKGIVAVLLIRMFTDNQWLHVLAGVAAIVGHNWPIYFGFKGGKGIATTIGVTATLISLPALYAGIIGLLLIATTRYVSLGSLVFTLLMPIFLLIPATQGERHGVALVLFAILICIFAWFRHRTNIVKLLKGQENKIFSKKNAASKGEQS
jgi:glycerol-3-phosphate acyltransferase PlsY